jgi:hypothetical protein
MQKILKLIIDKSKEYGIEKKFLIALVKTESNFNPYAVRYEKDYKWIYSYKECAEIVGCTIDTMINMQKCSWGLSQLMGANYYELQGKNWATVLLIPEINLKFCCEHLRRIIENQKLDIENVCDIYAAYNAGSIRKKGEEYINKKNVDRFFKIYNNL